MDNVRRAEVAVTAVFLLVVTIVPFTLVEARPPYMKVFNADPFTKDEYRDRCTVCHISRTGGENTYLGEDFGVSNHKLTKDIRERYPEFFTKEPRKKKTETK